MGKNPTCLTLRENTLMMLVTYGLTFPLVFSVKSGFLLDIFLNLTAHHLPRRGEGKDKDNWLVVTKGHMVGLVESVVIWKEH